MVDTTAVTPPILRRIPLPGDRLLVIRPEQPEDAPDLARLYDAMSEDERYCRFFTAHRPPDSFVEKMARVFERHGVGIVAEVLEPSSGSRLVAEASYEVIGSGDGELGIAVESGARGWLGPYLLDLLLEQASARGVPNLEAEVLMSNRRMITVLRSRGMVVLDHYQSPATLRVSIATAGDVPSWPGSHDRPRLLVEIPGGQWALASAMERHGFQVVACPGPERGGPPCGPRIGAGCPLASSADAIVVVALPGSHSDLLLSAHQRCIPEVPLFEYDPVAGASGTGVTGAGVTSAGGTGAGVTSAGGTAAGAPDGPGRVRRLPLAAEEAGDMLAALVCKRPDGTLASARSEEAVPSLTVQPDRS